MKPFQANFLNGIVLIAMGMWAYMSSEAPSFTSLIPVAFGFIFLALTGPFRRENKVVAHIIVVLTLLILLALIKPLTGVIAEENTVGIIRVVLMMLTSLIALIIFIKSFIDARKERTQP